MELAPQGPPATPNRITGSLTIAGIQFDVIDFPPDMFPAGAVLLSQQPNKLEILDRLVLPQGAMVAVLNPTQAAALRGQVHKAHAAELQKRKRDADQHS
jgi:hypothetical protein